MTPHPAPEISVIIPAYNTADYLDRTLRNIAEEQFGESPAELWEIIVVNDGSTDRTEAIAQEWAGRYPGNIRVITQPNQGVSAARNRGIDEARGEYIYFMDSDDLLRQGALPDLAAAASACSLDMLTFNFRPITPKEYEELDVSAPHHIAIPEGIPLNAKQYLLLSNCLSTPFMVWEVWRIIIRKEFIKLNGLHFNPEISFGEDSLFMLQCFCHNPRISAIPMTLYFYNNLREDNATAEFDSTKFERFASSHQRMSCGISDLAIKSHHNPEIPQRAIFNMLRIIDYDFHHIATSGITYGWSLLKLIKLRRQYASFCGRIIAGQHYKNCFYQKYTPLQKAKNWLFFNPIMSFCNIYDRLSGRRSSLIPDRTLSEIITSNNLKNALEEKKTILESLSQKPDRPIVLLGSSEDLSPNNSEKLHKFLRQHSISFSNVYFWSPDLSENDHEKVARIGFTPFSFKDILGLDQTNNDCLSDAVNTLAALVNAKSILILPSMSKTYRLRDSAICKVMIAHEWSSLLPSGHTPRISIIIPAYNTEVYLDRTLRNIVEEQFDQCNPDYWEVIIINDGSTDATETIALKWKQRYPENIRVITQANSGVSAARNRGIEEAHGEYIYFMDSDDLLRQGALPDLTEAASKNGLDMLAFNYIEITQAQYQSMGSNAPQHEPIPSPVPITSHDYMWTTYGMDYVSGIWAVWRSVFRRELFIDNNLRFDTSLQFGEDQMLCLRLYFMNIRMSLLPSILYFYNCSNQTNSTSCVSREYLSKAIPQRIKLMKLIHRVQTQIRKDPNLPNLLILNLNETITYAFSRAAAAMLHTNAPIIKQISLIMRYKRLGGKVKPGKLIIPSDYGRYSLRQRMTKLFLNYIAMLILPVLDLLRGKGLWLTPQAKSDRKHRSAWTEECNQARERIYNSLDSGNLYRILAVAGIYDGTNHRKLSNAIANAKQNHTNVEVILLSHSFEPEYRETAISAGIRIMNYNDYNFMHNSGNEEIARLVLDVSALQHVDEILVLPSSPIGLDLLKPSVCKTITSGSLL